MVQVSAVTRASAAPASPRALSSRRSSLAGRRAVCAARTRGGPARARFRVSAYEQADTDGEAVKVDIPMADVSKGKKIGSGSFGDVFEGTWKGKAVILKERKLTGPGKKYFDAEASLNRRLKSAKGVAPFLGVAGANAFLVWKDEGRSTLDAVLGGGSGGASRSSAAAAAAAADWPPRWASATRAARFAPSPSSSCRRSSPCTTPASCTGMSSRITSCSRVAVWGRSPRSS